MAVLLAASVLAGCATGPAAGAGDVIRADLPRPLVIAHRGASGERPEHTIEAYRLAVDQGADCIEPDLVMTKDGVLVARHDIYLSTTTDVESRPEFAARRRPAPDKDHAGMTDWWVADFTLAELQTLKARQPFRNRSKAHDGSHAVPTFAEVLAFANTRRTASGRAVCVYPEAKAPAYHNSLGFDMAAAILKDLKAAGYDKPGSPVFIQTFEPAFAKDIDARTTLPVVMLAGDQAALDAAWAMPGAPFWQGEGVTHAMLFGPDGKSSGLIEKAHARGLQVHAWTYRDDAPFAGEPIETSIRKALAIGLDGFFTDFPATGVRAVAERPAR
jgi:glycerophosphoryl diester phosphodiesterase